MPLRCARCAKKRACRRPQSTFCCFCTTIRDTARDICTYRQLKPALVSLYVENLVQSGHLRRESVPEDRRKCRLLLTAQALPVVEKGLALQAAFTAQMFAGLSKEDLASGQRCLAAVTQNIQTINQKGSA